MQAYIERFYLEWDANVRKYAVSLRKPYHIVEDALSESVYKVLSRGYESKSFSHFCGLLYTSAKNYIVDSVRVQDRMVGIKDEISRMPDEDGCKLQSRERYKDLKLKMRRLPKRYKQIMFMRGMGIRYVDIADMLNIPEGTVKAGLHYARCRIRSM